MTVPDTRLREAAALGVPKRGGASRVVWVSAFVGAVLLHASAVAALFVQQSIEVDDEVGAPAISISLDFTTTLSEESDLPPGPEAEASEAATAAIPQARPVEDVQAPQEAPTTSEDADRVVSPEATERVTDKVIEKPTTRTSDAAPSQESIASEAAAPVKIEGAKQGAASAAPVLGAGRTNARERAAWQKRLVTHLDRNKRYPRAEESRSATVVVSFSIDRTGRLVSADVRRSSGDAAFDRAAIAMLKRADPVPAPPPALADDGLTFTVPVVFRARSKR